MIVEDFKDAIMPAVESAMLYSCLTVAQDVSEGLLVLPSALAADSAETRGNLFPSAQVGVMWERVY